MEADSRQVAMLYEFLMHDKERLEYAYLCRVLGACQRTLRKDVRVINDHFRGLGLYIADEGGGLRLTSPRPELVTELKRQFQYRFSDVSDILQGFDLRRARALAYFFTAGPYVRIDELAAHLSLNRRSVTGLLVRVRALLKETGIELAARPHYGMYLRGPEINIRYCYVDTVSFYVDSASLSDDLFGDSLAMLRMQQPEQDMVTAICLDYLRAADVPLSQIELRKLIVLIMVSHRRWLSGHRVAMTAAQRRLLDAFGYDLCIPWLMGRLQKAYDVEYDQGEADLLKMFLMSTVDCAKPAICQALPAAVRKRAAGYLDGLLDQLADYGIVGPDSREAFRTDLAPVLASAAVRSFFHIVENNPNSSIKRAVVNSPVSVWIGIICFERLQRMAGEPFGQTVYINIALAVYACIRRTSNIRKTNVLAILTPADAASGESLKRRILDRYGNVVSHIDVLTTPMMLKTDMSRYNYLILFENMRPFGLPPGIPVLQVDYYFTETDVSNFFEYVANPSRIYRRAFGPIRRDDYLDGLKTRTLAAVLRWLMTQTDDPLLRRQLAAFKPASRLIANGTLNVILFTKRSAALFSKLIRLERSLDYKGQRYSRIFVHALQIDGDMIRLKTAEKVTRNLTTIADTDDTVMADPPIDFYDYYIFNQRHVLR